MNLKSFNTFGIEATCAEWAEVTSVESLKERLHENKQPVYIVGGGSNILLTQAHYQALFIKNAIKGIEIEDETPDSVVLKIGSGEVWHDLVLSVVERGWGGIENLSLIPGTAGAAPIQNIGAYGVEIKDVLLKVECLDLDTLQNRIFSKEECQLGYRDSIFKKEAKGRYFISYIYLKLTKNQHSLHTQYGDIQKILAEKHIAQPTIKDISEAVITIRQSKLPDPSVLGNAGSFFKNPEISTTQFEALKEKNPNIVGYPTAMGVKLAAGWLIEQCGWKGQRQGAVGVHERQALVLVNYGDGKGEDIQHLSQEIQKSVMDKWGVRLEAEVNFW